MDFSPANFPHFNHDFSTIIPNQFNYYEYRKTSRKTWWRNIFVIVKSVGNFAGKILFIVGKLRVAIAKKYQHFGITVGQNFPFVRFS